MARLLETIAKSRIWLRANEEKETTLQIIKSTTMKKLFVLAFLILLTNFCSAQHDPFKLFLNGTVTSGPEHNDSLVPVMIIYCDTSSEYYQSIDIVQTDSSGGSSLVTCWKRMVSDHTVKWMNGYSVRRKRSFPRGEAYYISNSNTLIPGNWDFDDRTYWEHVKYLDADFRPLSDKIVVSQMIELK